MSNLFRKKNLERISSPEQLNEYIRVSTPSVWMVLAAVIVLLVGVCVWGVFGHMNTTLTAAAVSREGVLTAYVRAADVEKVSVDAAVTVAGTECKVESISAEPVLVDDTFSEYMRQVGSLQLGEWVYALVLQADCPDGVYIAQIVVDSVSPMSFVLN